MMLLLLVVFSLQVLLEDLNISEGEDERREAEGYLHAEVWKRGFARKRGEFREGFHHFKHSSAPNKARGLITYGNEDV